MTIWRMCFACWILKATCKHSDYVNTYCFPYTKMVARTRINVMIYVHSLSLFLSNVIPVVRVELIYVESSQ